MGIKINEYPLERLTFGDDDYYDIDYWNGSSYETAKIKGITIKNALSGGGGASELNDLTDVTITNPVTQEVLRYDGTQWVNSFNSTNMIEVRNDEGATIGVGVPLYSKGEIGGSNRILVGIADANDPAKMPVIGIAQSELNTSTTQDGYAVVSGVFNENLSGFTGLQVGDIVYASTTGTLTQTKPTASNELIQNVGIVLKTNGTVCQGLLVSAIGRTNDVPNQIQVTGSIRGSVIGVQGEYDLPLADGSQSGQLLATDASGQAYWINPIQVRQAESLIVACSDETTVLSVSSPSAVITFRSAYEMTISNLRTSLTTAGTGGGVTEVDITVNGTTIFTTRLSIDSGQTTSMGASVPYQLATLPTVIPDNAEVKVIITQITNEPTETGLKLMINNTRG